MSPTLKIPEPPSPATLAVLRSAFAHVPDAGSTGESVGTDPERIWEAVHGPPKSGDEASRLELIDRLPHDPQLALEWRLAAAMGPVQAEHEGAPPAHAAPAAPRRQGTLQLILGIAVAAAAALGVWISGAEPSGGDDPLDEEPAWRAPDSALRLHTELGVAHPLPRDDFRLRWSSQVQNATSFALRVTTQELTPVFEQHALSTTEVVVPVETLAAVPAGTVLLWRVEAVEPNGRRHPSPVWEIAVE